MWHNRDDVVRVRAGRYPQQDLFVGVEATKDFGSDRPTAKRRLALDSPREKIVDHLLSYLRAIMFTALAPSPTKFNRFYTKSECEFSINIEQR